MTRKVTHTCSNILSENGYHQLTKGITSVRTSECVMLFSDANCLGRSTKIQPPGTTNLQSHWESTVTGLTTLSLLYKSFPDWNWTTKSFYFCQESNGIVEISKFHVNLNTLFNPYIYKTNEHFCTCQNIPLDVRSLERWSINNHDTSIIAYFEPECTSRTFAPLHIPAGQSSYSIALGSFTKINKHTNDTRKILSIGPDHGSCYFRKNCIKLYSTITKFEIIGENFTEQVTEMKDSGKIYRNDGPKDLVCTFTASETVKDSFSVDVGISLDSMQQFGLENSFEVETKMKKSNLESNSDNKSVEAGISASVSGPLKTFGVKLNGSISGSISKEQSSASYMSHEAFVQEGLRKAYQNQNIIENSKNIAKTVESTKSFTVSEVITVPPCSEQILHVKTVKNRHIEYRALVKINGYLETTEMTAIEVRKFMDDRMQYVGDYDTNTVLAYSTTGFLTVKRGVAPMFSTKVESIPECVSYLSILCYN